MSRAEAASGQRGGLAPPLLAAGAVADQRAGRWAGLSAFLTGYGRVELTGTGLSALYLDTLDSVLPAGVLDELLDAFGRLPAGVSPAAAEDGDAAAAAILDDPKLGPVARSIIVLWYCGTWTALPDPWRAAYGASPLDTSRVLSAQAYQGGLQWTAAGAHPAGARQPGYGAWAVAPDGTRG